MQTNIPGGAQPPIVINQKSSTIPLAIVALAIIALLGVVLVLGGFVVLAVLATPTGVSEAALEPTFAAGDPKATARAALIRIEGVIMQEPAVAPFRAGRDPVAWVKKRLQRALRDRVKAILLEVNSPGGAVTASDLIYREILKFKKDHPGIPVVVQMKDLAASGGYYVSAPADWIVAMPTTLTASIGVVLVHQNMKGLLEGKLGIQTRAYTSGAQKDILSPFREATPAEQKHIQGIIDEMFDRFVNVVTRGREGKITADQVRALQGTVLTGQDALARGLVDQIGTLDDAVAKAAELAKVKRLRVIRYAEPRTLLEQIFTARFQAEVKVGPTLDLDAYLARGGSPILYLWRP